MKQKIWLWFLRKVLRIPEGMVLPKWAWLLGILIFPIQVIRWWPDANLRYDPFTDSIMYSGQRFKMMLLRDITRLKICNKIVISKDDDGETIIWEMI